jgi:hypothetical protein
MVVAQAVLHRKYDRTEGCGRLIRHPGGQRSFSRGGGDPQDCSPWRICVSFPNSLELDLAGWTFRAYIRPRGMNVV